MSQKKITVLFVSLFLITSTSIAQSYQLRLTTPTNDSCIYRITETTDFVIKADEKTELNNETKIVDYQFLVEKSNAKGVSTNTQITIKNIFIEKKGSDKLYTYNSKDTDASKSHLDKSYGKLINHQFDVKFDSIGKVSMLENFDAVFNEDFSTADIFDNTDFDALKLQVKEEFSTNTFEQTMRYFQYAYPIDSINIGESWTIMDTIYPNFGVLSRMTYTLKEIKNNIAYLDIKADLAKIPNFKGLDMDLMHLKFNLQGQQEGLVLLDLQTGWIRKMSIAQELTGKMTVFFIDPQGKTLRIKLKGSTDYDLINY